MGRPKNIRHDGRRRLSHRRGLQILPSPANRLLFNPLTALLTRRVILRTAPFAAEGSHRAMCRRFMIWVPLRPRLKSPDTSQKTHQSTAETYLQSLPSIPRSNASPPAPSSRSSTPPSPLAPLPILPPAAAASHKPKP